MATQESSSTLTLENDTNMSQQEGSTRRLNNGKGFGKFQVYVAGLINLKLVRRIATYFDFQDSDIDILNDNDDPGLQLLYMMRSRGLITADDINELIMCLNDIDSTGIANDILKSFKENGCGKSLPAQEKDDMQEESSLRDGFYSSAEMDDCTDGTTSETQSSLQKSRKRKIGKRSSSRLTRYSGNEYVYVLERKTNFSQLGNKRVKRNEDELGSKWRKHQDDKDGENSAEHSESDVHDGGNNDEGVDDGEVKYHDDEDKEKENENEDKDRDINRKQSRRKGKDGCGIDDIRESEQKCGEQEEENEEDEENQNERGILVAATLVGKSQDLKMMYVTKDRLKTNIQIGQVYKICGYLANEDEILLSTPTKIKKSGEDELFQDIQGDKKRQALTLLSNASPTIKLPVSDVNKVKYEFLGKTPVNSLKVIVTKVALHVGYSKYSDSYERKAYITVADSENDMLKVIAHDKHISTSMLGEGSIIQMLNFETHRSAKGDYNDTNCLVSRRGSNIKLIGHKDLQELKTLLPLTDSYQVEGKLIEINVDLNTYDACPRPQCHEKKVEVIAHGDFYCKKCGETYKKNKILEGFSLDLKVKDGKNEDYIIFKSTMASTLREFGKNPDVSNTELQELFDKCFFKKVIRMVVKPSDGPSVEVVMSMQVLE